MNLARNSTCNIKQFGTKTWRLGCGRLRNFLVTMVLKLLYSPTGFAIKPSRYCQCMILKQVAHHTVPPFIKGGGSAKLSRVQLVWRSRPARVGGSIVLVRLSNPRRLRQTRVQPFITSQHSTSSNSSFD